MNMDKVVQTVITKSIDIELNKNKVIVSFLSGGSSSILSGAAIRISKLVQIKWEVTIRADAEE